MSLAGLVEYGSSDESENDDVQEEKKLQINYRDKDNSVDVIKTGLKNTAINSNSEKVESRSVSIIPNSRLGIKKDKLSDDSICLFLNSLPKPKSTVINDRIIEEEDDIPMPIKNFLIEKPPKKEKKTVKISIPCLSDFDDLDDGNSSKKSKSQLSKKLPGVLALLPPPQSEIISTANLVQHVLTKTKTTMTTSLTPTQIKNQAKNWPLEKNTNNTKKVELSLAAKLDSDSEDEDDRKFINKVGKSMDFFSLSESINLPLSEEIIASNMLPMEEKKKPIETITNSNTNYTENAEKSSEISKKLTSVVMNLPRDDIILKNKAEVGPKLPVPEQEFNVDSEGNVAFDEKAIEYLCGKRGVKRKNQLINETDIIDINGEDIKPDEREWLVKALTEEPVPRPVSLKFTAGGNSKKKHQITYLAEQAKAMEIELKNQWAANKLARRQTKSKYGF